MRENKKTAYFKKVIFSMEIIKVELSLNQPLFSSKELCFKKCFLLLFVEKN